jgi:hypothetical protein
MEIFGLIGMAMAMSALGLIAKLKKEFEELKKNLKDSGVLQEQTEPEAK